MIDGLLGRLFGQPERPARRLAAPAVRPRVEVHTRASAAVAVARRARRGRAAASAYVGAGDRRSLRQWSPSAGSANADTLPDLDVLRARSRDLVRNNPLAGGAVNTNCSNVIGTGLTLHPQIDRHLLGLTEEEADAWEELAKRYFRAWAESDQCDVTRTQTFAGLQDLAFRAMLESGDVLAVRRFVERRGDVFGTKVQLIEGDRISNPELLLDTPRLAGGVEIDGNGVPIGYHVLNQHPGDVFWFSTLARRWTRIPAFGQHSQDRLAVLLYRRNRPGQLRGVPYLAPVIDALKQIGRYTEAELTAAVVASFLTVFIKTEAEGSVAGLAPLDGNDPNPPAASELKLGPGVIGELAPGEEVQTVDPKRPNDAFDGFFQAVVRQIGVGLEMPFEVLIKHFQSSYSAARAALLELWRTTRVRRQLVATSFCQPCYEWVMAEAIARGRIEAPGFDEDPLLRRAWLRARWVGPGMGHIDPNREAQGAAKLIEIGVSTIEEQTAQITGGDYEENHEQRAKEMRLRRAAGLETATPAPGAAPTPPVDEDDPDAADRAELAAAAT